MRSSALMRSSAPRAAHLCRLWSSSSTKLGAITHQTANLLSFSALESDHSSEVHLQNTLEANLAIAEARKCLRIYATHL